MRRKRKNIRVSAIIVRGKEIRTKKDVSSVVNEITLPELIDVFLFLEGMTQAELAEHTSRSAPTICRILKRETLSVHSVPLVLQIGKTLGIPQEFLKKALMNSLIASLEAQWEAAIGDKEGGDL